MKTPSVRPTAAPSLRRSFFPSTSFLRRALAVALLAGTASLSGAEPAVKPPAAAEKIVTPILTTDETAKKNLLELDRLLDLPGSKLEEILRKNIEQIEVDATAKTIPELAVVLKEQPWILPALRTERQFLLHRYIARRARGPLLRPDVIALDKFLSDHADIRRLLNRDPAKIVEGNFLTEHPVLAEFFTQHPSLSSVLLIPQGGRRSDPKAN